jgi:hypothetical protein
VVHFPKRFNRHFRPFKILGHPKPIESLKKIRCTETFNTCDEDVTHFFITAASG